MLLKILLYLNIQIHSFHAYLYIDIVIYCLYFDIDIFIMINVSTHTKKLRRVYRKASRTKTKLELNDKIKEAVTKFNLYLPSQRFLVQS